MESGVVIYMDAIRGVNDAMADESIDALDITLLYPLLSFQTLLVFACISFTHVTRLSFLTHSLTPACTHRVNTFRRNDILKAFLRHFTTCPNVHAIQVVWSDQSNRPPPLSFFQLDSSSRVAVQFEEQPTDSLNNRFRPILPIETPAVLSLDDDLEIACEDLDFAYSVWQSSPQSLVGFTPRLVTWDEAHVGYRYQSSYKMVWWHGLYNMILTKCCFMHKDFFSSYFSSLSEETLAFIDEHRNCEDIAMQFVVSNQTGGIPPVWVQSRFKDRGVKSGISQGKDHQEERSTCVTRLVKEFGHMPLTLTSHKAINAKKAWIF